MRSRDKQLSEKKRERMSLDADDADNTKILYDKLFFGFKTRVDVMQSMQIVRVPRSIIIPVSSRGIGFMTRRLLHRFSRSNIKNLDFHNLCASLYRVTLCMYEIKLVQAMQNQVSTNLGQNFENLLIPIDVIRAIETLGSGFVPLINLISSIGLLKAYGTLYMPRLACPMSARGFNIWDPTLVSFTNLRDYVMALSDPVTPQAERRWFYDHSPLPCAVWNQPAGHKDVASEAADNNWPLLLNPDHIMPGNYSLAGVREDVDTIMTSLELIGRKYPKYIFTGRIDYDGPGLASQLVSNYVSDVRCSDIIDLPNAYSLRSLEGNINMFWSNEIMSESEFYMGMIHLFGELPRFPDDRWAIRQPTTAKDSIDNDYLSSLTNVVSQGI